MDYGVILGRTYYNDTFVNIYSNNRKNYFHTTSCYGVPYECVEFVRRWLYLCKRIELPCVSNAYELFTIPHLIKNKKRMNVHRIHNGSYHKPVIGSILIWNKEGIYDPTGHVAIVVKIDDHYVYIAEQNMNNTRMNHYTRKLPITNNPYTIHDPSLLGWLLY